MKAPIEWLKEFVEINISPEELADKLTMAGVEVGAIEYHGKNISDVVVGKIKNIERHAAKSDVFICQVDTGIKILQIVTKAKNMKVGDKVPVALHGANLPSGMKIETREMHGVESFGMLCSNVELGLSSSAEGILILDKDSAVGEDIRKVLGIGGAVLDIDVLPNRIDLLSVIGVAREIGAVLGKKTRYPLVHVKESQISIKNDAKVLVKDADLCPRYMARVIKGVTVKPSPGWIEEKLVACGMRPVNNIVDATNYVLLEMGQPLHAFDLKYLKDRNIIVRQAKKGERITTIDGEKRELNECLVIADVEKPVAIAGIMGSKDTEVTEGTKDILLESAYFDPRSIHKTEKNMKLRTEASVRFDRGVDWDAVEVALDKAAVLIADLAGGEILKGKIDVRSKRSKPKQIKLRLERANKILGTKLKAPIVRSILNRLGFTMKGSVVDIPLYRAGDIEREIDVIEEIGRIYGYENIPVSLPGLKIRSVETLAQKQITRIRDVLVDIGLMEVITYSMLPSEGLDGLSLIKAPGIKILNPISEDLSCMRDSILPSLLNVLTYNLNHQISDVNIFEIGKAFFKNDKGQPIEKMNVAAVFHGRTYYRYDGVKEDTDFFKLKTIMADILNLLGVKYSISERKLAGFHPGKSAEIYKDGKTLIGIFGELHPEIMDKIGVKAPIYAFSLDLSDILGVKKLPQMYKEIALYPATKRDIAMIVPYGVTNKAILDEIRVSGGNIVESVELFDKYEGKQIEQGYYSLAYSIIYRDTGRTLTDEEVNLKHTEISDNLAKKLNIKVRK